MGSKLITAFAALTAGALIVAALWAWQQAPHLALDAEKPEIILRAIHAAAIATVALGQSIILLAVIGNMYRTRRIDRVLRTLAAGVFLVALVSAIALGLAGRSL